jgi:hypothetical protein
LPRGISAFLPVQANYIVLRFAKDDKRAFHDPIFPALSRDPVKAETGVGHGHDKQQTRCGYTKPPVEPQRQFVAMIRGWFFLRRLRADRRSSRSQRRICPQASSGLALSRMAEGFARGVGLPANPPRRRERPDEPIAAQHVAGWQFPENHDSPMVPHIICDFPFTALFDIYLFTPLKMSCCRARSWCLGRFFPCPLTPFSPIRRASR